MPISLDKSGTLVFDSFDIWIGISRVLNFNFIKALKLISLVVAGYNGPIYKIWKGVQNE